jgi:hypothetical protein
MDLGLDIRKDILEYSLMMEMLTTNFLASILDIKEPKNSKTLGNKTSSFSFNHKIDLLIDLGALRKEERKKYQYFMEIRNQFMHNIDASSYEKCLAYLDGTNIAVLKLYPQPESLSLDEKYKNAVFALCEETLDLTIQIIDTLNDKFSCLVNEDTSEKAKEK